MNGSVYVVDLSYNSKIVLKERYLIKDDNGNTIETPEEMFLRVAKTIASIEIIYGKSLEEALEFQHEVFTILDNLEFLPNSPTLMNAGTKLGLLSACFVLPIPDDMEGIADAIKMMMIIQKMGGGTGFSFSRLRPEGDYIKSTGGTSSGPISFMKAFNGVTNIIKQGGKRRGANMGVMRIDHPDIMEFILSKMEEFNNDLENFNLSVAITDKFMNALEKGEDYEIVNPKNNEVVDRVSAFKIWEYLCALSWMNGEPAVIFIDRMNDDNPTPEVGLFETTNPCGEVPLLPYESCNLGSINLSKFVKYNKITWNRLEEVVKIATRFLDNVIDANRYPFPQIEEMTKANRKIGLGVMGWADMLIKLGIPYDSQEAVDLAEKIMEFISSTAWHVSVELGKEKGSFPNKSKSIYKGFEHLRNATVTSIAPSGTISIIADTTYGIEPVFSIIAKRNVEKSLGKQLKEINPAVKELLKKRDLWSGVKPALFNGGCINLPKDIRDLVPVANNIAPEWHVKMQAAFQRHVQNSISKTVNLPEKANVEDISEIYKLAYKFGCKGITIYRNGSRKEQLLEANDGSCPTCTN